MSSDIGELLIRDIRRDFAAELGDNDKRLAKLLKKITDGKADFNDVSLFSSECGKALSRAIAKNISLDMLKDGMLTYDIPLMILRNTLKDNYDLINMAAQAVQQRLDNELGIHIDPLTAAFPTARVDAIAGSLTDKAASDETLKRRMDAPVRNVTDSFYTDYVEANADFRSRAGLKTTITRQTNGKCCDWCAALAGHYVYPDVPENIWAFHDNCTCSVLYSSSKTTSVHNRRNRQGYRLEGEERKKALANVRKPVRYTPEQAERIQNNVLNRLAFSVNGGIIRDSNNDFLPITEQSISRIGLLNVFNDERDSKVAEAMRTMLNSVINKEPGTETTSIFSLDDMSLINTLTSESADGSVQPLNHDKPFVSIHNHPSGETFSLRDIYVFQTQNNCKSMYVVGNNGNVYLLTKTPNYDSMGLYESIMKVRLGFSEYSNEEDFIKECEQHGIKYFKRTD